MTIGVQLVGGSTIRAFGDHASSDAPWYYHFWFVVTQFVIGSLAVVLASLAMIRTPSRMSAVALSIAAAVFLQGTVSLYYRVVVSHFGYDAPLSRGPVSPWVGPRPLPRCGRSLRF